MSQYLRVLPRDLFNEAKLLKCIGKLICAIDDDQIPGLSYYFINDGNSPFAVSQDPDSGNLSISNIVFFDNDETPIRFYTNYNSKDNYPLVALYEGNEYYIFNENGEVQTALNLFL